MWIISILASDCTEAGVVITLVMGQVYLRKQYDGNSWIGKPRCGQSVIKNRQLMEYRCGKCKRCRKEGFRSSFFMDVGAI